MAKNIMDDPDRAFYTIDEVRRQIGLSKSKAYEFARKGVFPCVVIGRQYRVPKALFERWKENPKATQS